MVVIKDLEPGMVVKIVDDWDPSEKWAAPFGEMDKWLGLNMTIKYVCDNEYVEMEEDEGEYLGTGWSWFPSMLECVVEQVVNVDFDEDEFLSLFDGEE